MMLFNNYYTKGVEKSISSNGGVAFAMLWCDAKSIQFNKNGYYFGFGPPANIDYPESKRISTTVPFENQKFYYQMGINCIKEKPERLISNFSSVVKLFNSHLFPTIGNVKYWETFRSIFRLLTNILFFIGLASFFGILGRWIKFEKTNKKYFYFIALIVLSVPLTVYLLSPGEERYFMPYAPLLIILSVPIIFFLIEATFSKFSHLKLWRK